MEHAVLAYIAKINLLGMVFNIFVLFLLVSVIMESVKQMMDVVMVGDVINTIILANHVKVDHVKQTLIVAQIIIV
uniref:Uncharacterized protein n=1 Tax=Meloidogyne enterolobii TaxID=390850 RepID=A0A6V7WHX8_MELEN|nr:unnamed protein product [Meloidogyne enterolobii]